MLVKEKATALCEKRKSKGTLNKTIITSSTRRLAEIFPMVALKAVSVLFESRKESNRQEANGLVRS
jgi:hypothetical protein